MFILLLLAIYNNRISFMIESEMKPNSRFQVDQLAYSQGTPIATATINAAYARIVIPPDASGHYSNWRMRLVTSVSSFNPRMVWLQLLPSEENETLVLYDEHSAPSAVFCRLSSAEDINKIVGAQLDWCIGLSPRITANDLSLLRPTFNAEDDMLMGTFDRLLLNQILASGSSEYNMKMIGKFRVDESKFRRLVQR